MDSASTRQFTAQRIWTIPIGKVNNPGQACRKTYNLPCLSNRSVNIFRVQVSRMLWRKAISSSSPHGRRIHDEN